MDRRDSSEASASSASGNTLAFAGKRERSLGAWTVVRRWQSSSAARARCARRPLAVIGGCTPSASASRTASSPSDRRAATIGPAGKVAAQEGVHAAGRARSAPASRGPSRQESTRPPPVASVPPVSERRARASPRRAPSRGHHRPRCAAHHEPPLWLRPPATMRTGRAVRVAAWLSGGAPARGQGGQAPRRSPGGEERRPQGEVPARDVR